MEFLVLGPLEITHEGRSVVPTAAKDRAFLGELLAHPGQLITAEHLADRLWPERPPADPINAVQVRASRLRAMLRSISDADTVGRVLRTRSGGYELDPDHATSDLAAFEAAASGVVTAESLREGLALWRGAPFGDVPRTPCVEIQVARAEELRLSVLEAYADLCLAANDLPAALVADLAEQAARHPLREPLHHRLMSVLCMTGRPAEALACYERLRTTLADELGTDPQLELRRLHQEILAEPGRETVVLPMGEAAVAPPAEKVPAGRRRRLFPRLATVALACSIGLLVAGFTWKSTRGPEGPDPSARPVPGDRSRLDADVTYPDGASVKVGERFVKTWRFANAGTVAWHGRYLDRQTPLETADRCSSQRRVRIPDIEPGQMAEVSVEVTAAETPGRCKVYWKMVDAQGVLYMPHQTGVFFDVQVIR